MVIRALLVVLYTIPWMSPRPGSGAEPKSAARIEGPAAGRVESCTFDTKSLPPAFRPPKQFAAGYKLFQAGGARVPESVTVKGVVLLGNANLPLTEKETAGLAAGLDDVYARIAADPLLAGVPSALPYCLADKRPTAGHYFAYYPAKMAADTSAIIFLHGYGGNFLFYTYLLKEAFPDAVILVPSWGASWHDGTQRYLDDMLADVRRRTPLTAGRPCLMAISAGGPAGFRLYNDAPQRYACYVSLASAPSLAIVLKLKDELKILMINGRRDSGFRIAHVQSLAAAMDKRLPHFQLHVLDGDHFFLLSHREETFRTIKAFLKKEAGWPAGN